MGMEQNVTAWGFREKYLTALHMAILREHDVLVISNIPLPLICTLQGPTQSLTACAEQVVSALKERSDEFPESAER